MTSAITTQFSTILIPLLVSAAVGILSLRRRNAARARPAAPLEAAEDGTIAVPIHSLYLRRTGIFGGDTNNSVNPRFVIGTEGISYHLFRQGWLPFSAIDHVELRERFGFVHLLFLNSSGPRLLSINVGDRDIAKEVLNALPRTVALTPQVATIRDGSADAAAPGLRLYSGPFA